MHLLEHGCGVQARIWGVEQKSAAGFCRVYYLRAGHVTYSDDRTPPRPLYPGRLYVFSAQTPYRIAHDPNQPIDCLWLHVDLHPHTADRLLEIDVMTAENGALRGIIAAMCSYEAAPQDKALYASLAEALSLCIIAHPIMRDLSSVQTEVLEYIRENLSSPELSVEHLSRRFGYSTAHFIRLFKSGMHTTPHRYITMLRMMAAGRCLTEGRSVTETAALCGYSDIKTFSRLFKSTYGIPPSAYPRYYRANA